MIKELQGRYQAWVTQHPTAARDFRAAVKELLYDAGLAFDQVSARVKQWPSLRAKAVLRNPDGSFIYPDPWADLHDLVGVRVTTYHSTEIPGILSVLGDAFTVERQMDKGAETRTAGRLGYGSHHLVCRVPSGDVEVPPGLEPYRGLLFEIQVRTVLQHAWAEFEHDIRYKTGTVDPRINRAFALAAGLIELADQQFDQIAAITDEARAEEAESAADADVDADASRDRGPLLDLAQDRTLDRAEDVEVTAETLPGLLTLLLPGLPPSKSEHYEWLAELLSLNDVRTVGEIAELIDPDLVNRLSDALHYKFTPGHVRIVDDLLLARFGDAHAQATGNTGAHPKIRPQRLESRLRQLRKAGIVGV